MDGPERLGVQHLILGCEEFDDESFSLPLAFLKGSSAFIFYFLYC